MTTIHLRLTRCFLDSLMEITGLYHWTKRNQIPPITNPLLLQTATELAEKTRTGQLKCETLVRVFIDRINVVNPLVNAVVANCFNDAIKEAREYDRRIEMALNDPLIEDDVLKLPLLGVPITIKECITVKGMPNTAGLYSRKDFRAPEDAQVVKNVRKAGAIVLGVTNVPEFLLWWDTNNHVYGRARNPYDLSRITGGSSGGEAAIQAAAGTVIGVGSDIGGSLRIPPFFCGTFGHKPSSHMTNTKGNFPSCGHESREKLLVNGPLCRYATDLKPLFKVIISDDEKALAQLDLDRPVDLKKSRFYFLYEDGDPFKTAVSYDVRETLQRARNFLEKDCGFVCIDALIPLMKYNFAIFLTTLGDCDAPLLCEEILERHGKLNAWPELIKGLFGLSKFRKITCMNVILENAFYSPELRQKLWYRKIIDKGKQLREQLDSLLDDGSILIMPCLPEHAPKHSGTFLRVINCGYTAVFNVLEMPVTQISMGIGQRSQMPVGFQIIAKRLNDRYTLAVAELLAKKFGGWQPPCDIRIS
ncbi:fatty-acid amide hydrolase-like protein [Euroglyphus maynei]|uniref:Fatty-acid amide hydrolase-like protein n=1 Tax=Euroglyphus maynei TaxID=6958 RepID=A0A1Y3BLA4_EURMA|nr:fatty-acid amide hydrolase-like protein [Euroglyphus maynei]